MAVSAYEARFFTQTASGEYVLDGVVRNDPATGVVCPKGPVLYAAPDAKAYRLMNEHMEQNPNLIVLGYVAR